jgi:class 3 adenylate cyclase/predicted ATPase
VEFRILGSLDASVDGRALPLGPTKQRALLAVLLIRANEVVTSDALIDALWPEQPPETAANALQVYVSGLRRALGPSASLLETRPLGYAVTVGSDVLDRDRFENLLGTGRAALGAGDPTAAGETLREALSLWRGPALADFRYEPFAQAEIARLEDLRLAANEERIEADLALGRHAELVGELEGLVAAHPVRERLRGQLMLALYRSGRQAEALEVYQETRRGLVEELGIEPSQPLRDLEAAILRQDAALTPPTAAAPVRVAPPPGKLAEAPPAAAPPEAGEARKIVTILFCDVVDSTGLGERLDPEALRRVMSRYFDVAAEIVGRHGGTIEKFIGDAVMAVFGVPRIHEDDALRAGRAAVELRDAVASLGEELDRAWGARLAVRIGVNTGEVIAGGSGPHPYVTGTVVNIAARLQEDSSPGRILIGEETYRLVRDDVAVEPAERLAVRGRRDPVTAYELQAVLPRPAQAERRLGPMVGRERERELLAAAYARVVDEHACRLFTILGAAGVGKSRLAAEIGASLADGATTLWGRSLPYGEGATFWPVLEVVRRAALLDDEDSPEQARAKIGALLEDEQDADAVIEPVCQLLGLVDQTATSEETFWAVRRVLETLARPRPLVLVLEDVHWAEPTLLDLVEYVRDWWQGSSFLVVCLARPDFLDARPSWARGRDDDFLVLEPLSAEESEKLLDRALGGAELGAHARARIAEASEGNPLFLEQMLAMVTERGPAADEEVPIPPSIHALLAARLDGLAAGERAVVERASVMGRTFSWEAVRDLLPEEAHAGLGEQLMALVHKELVTPEPSGAAREHSFRFRHILIRDAAYAALPKETRADLHERFADWLERLPGEYDEIVGYHLEQAVLNRSELGLLDDGGRELAERGGVRLGQAGRRALARGDVRAASKLLERAAALYQTSGDPRADLLVDASVAHRESGDLVRADAALAEAEGVAEREEDDGLRAWTAIERSLLRAMIDPRVDASALREAGEGAIGVFEARGDNVGLARAWRHVAQAHWTLGQCAPMEDALERALVHADRAGHEVEVAEVVKLLVLAVVFGPKEVQSGVPRCHELRKRAEGNVALEAWIDALLALLEAMRGNFVEARRLYRVSEETAAERGLNMTLANFHMAAGITELIADDPSAAESEFQKGYALLERMGERAQLSTMAAFLARSLYAQGRYGEAEEFVNVSIESASEDDLASQVIWRGTLAKLLARRGDGERAEALAREAVARIRTSDFVNIQADALSELGEVLRLLERDGEAGAACEEAFSLYEAKGNTVSAAASRPMSS